MNKTFISLCIATIVTVGYGWNWTRSSVPPDAMSVGKSQEAAAAELRYKHAEPAHWRALFLRQE